MVHVSFAGVYNIKLTAAYANGMGTTSTGSTHIYFYFVFFRFPLPQNIALYIPSASDIAKFLGVVAQVGFDWIVHCRYFQKDTTLKLWILTNDKTVYWILDNGNWKSPTQQNSKHINNIVCPLW